MLTTVPLLLLLLLLLEIASLQFCQSAAANNKVPQVAVHKAKNATDFIMKHVHKKPGGVNTAEEDILFSKTGSVSPGGANQIAEMLVEGDSCDPRPTTVAIPLNASDLRAFYFPTCTKVNRCGGCCGHDLSECAPTQIIRTTVKVMKCRYPEGSDSDIFEFEGLVDIPIDVHTACECRCRVQDYHCDPVKHTYSADTCQCQCRNRQLATQCPSNKHWNEQECACVCPSIPNCLNDEVFDFNTCSCRRGTVSNIGDTPRPTVDPCATSTIRCRPGFVLAMQSDGRCLCRVANYRKRRRHLEDVDWINYLYFGRHIIH